MSENIEKILLKPSEVMKILGIGRDTMFHVLLKDKNFPAFKIGKKYYINKHRLQEWIDNQCDKRMVGR